jgi:F-type H+-transporting ATPase subunit gamma
MSETTLGLQRKIHSASDLKSVVSTMKAIATISIGQYQDSVLAQHDYTNTVLLGILNCLQHHSGHIDQGRRKSFNTNTGAGTSTPYDPADHDKNIDDGDGNSAFENDFKTIKNRHATTQKKAAVAAVVFGSDQGLVGQFNENLADYVVQNITQFSNKKKIWAVGERIQARLNENGLTLTGRFNLPKSIGAITPLVAEILTELESRHEQGEISEVFLYYNRPTEQGIYEQCHVRLLPLDDQWRENILRMTWPGKNLPEVLGDIQSTLLKLVHEYLFVMLFRACAESLASENASRLAAMHRAEKNIDELLVSMHQQFHQLRQSNIDEELFDQVSGAQAIKTP